MRTRNSVITIKQFEGFKLNSPLVFMVLFTLTICILPFSAFGQMAKKQVPLSNGYLRLMADGSLFFNGQIETRGEFLAGGSLDSSNPNYEEGVYYEVESQEVNLQGEILDLFSDENFYFLLHRNPNTGQIKLLVFDSSGMAHVVRTAAINDLIENEQSMMNWLEIMGLAGSAAGTGGSFLMADSPLGVSVCIAVAIVGGIVACVPKLSNLLDSSSREIRQGFQNQIQNATQDHGRREISPQSIGFYYREGSRDPLILLREIDNHSERLLVPLYEIGEGLLESQNFSMSTNGQSEFCEAHFLPSLTLEL